MGKGFHYGRLLLIGGLAVTAFAGLGYRLVDLQVIHRFDLEQTAQNNTERTLVKRPHRGEIRSARGDLLATSIPARTVFADPSLLGGRHLELARVLAPGLKLSPQFLADRLQPRIQRYETNETGMIPVPVRYVVLKRKVRVEEWEQIQAALTNATFGFAQEPTNKSDRQLLRTLRTLAVQTEEDEIRFYPNKRLAAHVLGYVNDDDSAHTLVGKDGIEWNLNDQLTGVSGWRETERDHRGRELVLYRRQDVEARDGYNVFLTLDALLQQELESALAEAMDKIHPQGITGIIVRPRTGEVLALASLPNYDPNQPGLSSDDARRNRVIADICEPGSTFKSVVVAGALSDRVVTLTDVFDCERGRFAYGGRVLHDHDAYGFLTVEQIITKSSNIGAAKVGLKLGEAKLYGWMRNFGFGSRTGIELPGEVFGIVNSVKNWDKVTIVQIPMGHAVSVTRLQMLMAVAAIANDGLLMRPMLVSRVEDAKGQLIARYTPQSVRQVLRPEAAHVMVQALKTVATAEGTAPKAALDHYTVAGKTGTAQKVKPKEEGGGYYDNRFVASFIGFLPADDPEIAISIVLDDPPHDQRFGGVCAAPVFRRVAERAASYLNIKPDIGEPGEMPGVVTAGNNAITNAVAARP